MTPDACFTRINRVYTPILVFRRRLNRGETPLIAPCRPGTCAEETGMQRIASRHVPRGLAKTLESAQ
jgi:hypothetical protein